MAAVAVAALTGELADEEVIEDEFDGDVEEETES